MARHTMTKQDKAINWWRKLTNADRWGMLNMYGNSGDSLPDSSDIIEYFYLCENPRELGEMNIY